MGKKTVYGCEKYNSYSVWKNERQFKDEVRNYINLGVDILDYSNEPDQPAKWIREVIDDMNVSDRVKLVADLHDLDSVRRLEGIIPIPERELFNSADGLIYVSDPIQEISNKLHTITKPNIRLYSYCNKDVVKYDENKIKERRDAIVYEGGVNPLENRQMNEIYPYRNLFPIFKQLIAQGNEVHAFVGNSDAYMTGQNTGVVLYPPTEYDKLMEVLPNFKWGLLIFNNKNDTEPQVRFTLTNKMQEYLVAGLPVLACWCTESERWVNKHKIGLTFSDISQIGNASQFEKEYWELMNNIKTKRQELVMENFIWKLENLYSELLGLEKKSIPEDIRKLSIFEYGEEETEKFL